MDWAQPALLFLVIPVCVLFVLLYRTSLHPMPRGRRRALQIVRFLIFCLALSALSGPAWETTSNQQAVIFLLDHSKSQGERGIKKAFQRMNELAAALPGDTFTGCVSAGASAKVLKIPEKGWEPLKPDMSLLKRDGAQTNLARGLDLACALFPPGTARSVVLISDGVETRGNLEDASRKAALSDVVVNAVPAAGETRPDVRLADFQTSRLRSHEGASVSLTAHIESSISGTGTIKLFENGVQVESRDLRLEEGEVKTVTFRRAPRKRNLYRYMVRTGGFPEDAIAENNEALSLLEVRGRPLFLYVEGEKGEAHYLYEAMAREGIRLETRPPEAIPEDLRELSVYDGIIFSDIPAHKISVKRMNLIKDYVEHLAGGFVMIGGKNSFGVGGYYRTPIEELLPVKMKSPDKEEIQSVALQLVMDRSGSMSGQKIEICKSAAVATLELLTSKDQIGVVTFDSAAHWVVPMTRASNQRSIRRRISGISSGGGTNMQPGMSQGYRALSEASARIKHMIVLTDGQTQGGGFQALAARMASEGITVSAVAVGNGAAVELLKRIASSGGGEFYFTSDPSSIPQIFTQDTMKHAGRLIREENFVPQKVETHPMLKGWPAEDAPALLGYVKTRRKSTSQVPLVSDTGDPLLAHWRFGLGKVTAFTSDCKSRWASLWITSWPPYSQVWAQVLRETAREPQGRNMDIRVREEGEHARILVDVLEDAATFKNEAAVEADVYFVPSSALGSRMRKITTLPLNQQGPGRYEETFSPGQPGVYLIRARTGADMVSAGLVHNISREAAVGNVELSTLKKACRITGGTVIEPGVNKLQLKREGHARFFELYPWLLRLLLFLFVADLAIRRWENIAGLVKKR